MKIAILAAVAALSLPAIGVEPAARAPAVPGAAAKPTRLAIMCFKTGENSPPGSMTKVCFYNCVGSEAAITIPAVSICPLSIER